MELSKFVAQKGEIAPLHRMAAHETTLKHQNEQRQSNNSPSSTLDNRGDLNNIEMGKFNAQEGQIVPSHKMTAQLGGTQMRQFK